MTQLEQITASVAKALSLEEQAREWGHWDKGWIWLQKDGSNLLSDYWRCRCMDWLIEHNFTITMNEDHCVCGTVIYHCTAAEFPARAIHKLMSKP